MIEFPTFLRLTMATVNKEEVKLIKNIISIQNLILKQKPPVEHTGPKKTLLVTKSKNFWHLVLLLLRLGRLKTSSDLEPTSPLKGLTQELVAIQRQVENFFGTLFKIEVFQNLKKEAGPKPDSGVSIFISRNLYIAIYVYDYHHLLPRWTWWCAKEKMMIMMMMKCQLLVPPQLKKYLTSVLRRTRGPSGLLSRANTRTRTRRQRAM